MISYLAVDKDFNELSLRDLLEARDLYHVHLMHKGNVVATALGRYRIRTDDPWPGKAKPSVSKKPKEPADAAPKGKRTLENSEVRPYSWPCILVFVKEWVKPSQFKDGGAYQLQDMVPPCLYLPDGRAVPVCVIEAPRYMTSGPAPADITFPTNNIGGGYPVIARVQGREYVASIGCLLTDGHKTYALTNRHVCGAAGETLYSQLDGKLMPIGRSSSLQLVRKPFQEVYPEWPGKEVYVNMDVGLIEIINLEFWSAKIREIGQMGPLADLSIHNLSLRLIGCPVCAYGATSGHVQGEIHGLFYRYKAINGFDYVADFLIGQRTSRISGNGSSRQQPPPFATHPGDSGTLWLVSPQTDPQHLQEPMPIAVQWGAHEFVGTDGKPTMSFALATCLSSVCNQLNVDIVRDWNLDQPDTWGAVGHYSIAARACKALSGNHPKLDGLINSNLTIISYDEDDLQSNQFQRLTLADFVPLADVPDDVWKHGRQHHQRPHEGPNHFADMDQKRPDDGVDLLSLCQSPANIDPSIWDQFYGSVRDLSSGSQISYEHRGLLPFRVWQIFQAMVGFAKQRQFKQFLCAAGVLAHYVGDACQPLHISYLHDGDPTAPARGSGKGVHSAYEDLMVGAYRQQILDGLLQTPAVRAAELIQNGMEAAQRTIDLMRSTFQTLPPEEIVQTFASYRGANKGLAEALWEALGARTITVMQQGTHLLAVLWESAWVQGGGEEGASNGDLEALTQQEAMQIVEDPGFVPSCYINEIAKYVTGFAERPVPAAAMPTAPLSRVAPSPSAVTTRVLHNGKAGRTHPDASRRPNGRRTAASRKGRKLVR